MYLRKRKDGNEQRKNPIAAATNHALTDESTVYVNAKQIKLNNIVAKIYVVKASFDKDFLIPQAIIPAMHQHTTNGSATMRSVRLLTPDIRYQRVTDTMKLIIPHNTVNIQ